MFLVVGCSELVPSPEGAHARYDLKKAVFWCNDSKETFILTCTAGEWTGAKRNCPKPSNLISLHFLYYCEFLYYFYIIFILYFNISYMSSITSVLQSSDFSWLRLFSPNHSHTFIFTLKVLASYSFEQIGLNGKNQCLTNIY